MAHSVINPTTRSTGQANLQKLSNVNGQTYRSVNEFFFYSNSPEEIENTHLADNGKYLNMCGVQGNGQIYVWHYNGENSQTINATLMIYNSNSYDIVVDITHYGLTKNQGVNSDIPAWTNYIGGQSKTVTVPAGNFVHLFDWEGIGSNYVYGVVARASIKQASNGATAAAFLYDIAYRLASNVGNAVAFSAFNTSKQRGTGDGYYQYVEFDDIVFGTETTYKGFSFGHRDSVFEGVECSTITEPSTNRTYLLEGGYGQMFYIKMKIVNKSGASKRFKIFMGSEGGSSFPFVMLGTGLTTDSYVPAYCYSDVILTDIVANGGYTEVEFSMVIPAVSATPYIIGVHPA